jgi:hypothetical protein
MGHLTGTLDESNMFNEHFGTDDYFSPSEPDYPMQDMSFKAGKTRYYDSEW